MEPDASGNINEAFSTGWKPNTILNRGLDKIAYMPWAQTKGTNLTTKVTADKLLQAWKKAGSPTASKKSEPKSKNLCGLYFAEVENFFFTELKSFFLIAIYYIN